MKKIGTIYAAAVLLYLPLNIYQDYFNRPNLLPKLLRGLVFDGDGISSVASPGGYAGTGDCLAAGGKA